MVSLVFGVEFRPLSPLISVANDKYDLSLTGESQEEGGCHGACVCRRLCHLLPALPCVYGVVLLQVRLS